MKSMGKILRGSIPKGLLAASGLLIFYFAVVTFISGWQFAQDQFSRFWYFILALAFGFGIQVGLYTYLKNLISDKNQSTKVLVASGTTSTAAMISCCAHYLANILPILGITGLITIVTQYQVQLFWIGLAANLVGITYMANKVFRYHKGL
ncbi:MAG: hypothetical protein UU05_C0024G0010 [Candidatus Curtissbacteria bacterium GW2011_GWA1_40_47]|nr:MAG: hypothetical protein UT95_C0015G0023 [Candidatus Curtissbacteria bacterium GW2011_GWB1_40_28]KKR60913.1 MAG: hypothetical protein UT99_C0005G0028 [Candidatus Curtissbacteria bacterium GW2011_GWA2_40_31]KKR61454.1 MAG: hypothetical protein UU00_C0013G0030 [Microgenomates group bacterium GW2011_GWC1_40_35]KKR65243.1 MAG: hypothetical protein UU05_C0024G0010 [Candidatus Curtissbacteria bacterium GW2011_GWA1_40_47]KKR77612.1 MAG: hypothetical protein UU19_C0007G0021 [Candidatus Curtissbacte